MKLSTIKTGLTVAAGNAKLMLKKHAPDILMATGAVSIVGGTVLACRATLKATDVLEVYDDDMDTIKRATDLAENGNITYSGDDRNHDILIARSHLVLDMAKLYAPSVILIGGGIACMLAAHGIMQKRQAALMGAYSALSESFQQYRERVRAKLGEEEEKRIYLNADEVAKEGSIDEKTGEYDETLKFKGGDLKLSPYARIFEKGATDEWNDSHEMNKMFLRQTQNWFNNQLQVYGHVFLNDVYKALGFPQTSLGAITGWLKDEGDGFIDFGMYDFYGPNGDKKRDFVNGYEKAIILDFNVNGTIYDKI